MHDTLASRDAMRVLTAIDSCTCECVALPAVRWFGGADSAAMLAQPGKERGKLPEKLRVDGGTEFASKALDH